MPRQCIFCPNPANSKEHLWPDWALKAIGRHPPIVRRSYGVRKGEFRSSIQVKHVCSECNNGWMSTLEGAIRPYVQPMLHGVGLVLTKEQQSAMCLWIVKTAMVLQATTQAQEGFYVRDEREALRLCSTIPPRSLVWIGKFSTTDGLMCDGMGISLNVENVPKAAYGCVTTIILGQFLAQALTVHYPAHYDREAIALRLGNGPWDLTLVPIYPHTPRVEWPPPLVFTEKGPMSFRMLLDRWKLGAERKQW